MPIGSRVRFLTPNWRHFLARTQPRRTCSSAPTFVRGETVLITGASGGVGSAAVQLAKRRGAIVIAVASASKADEIASLGASKVFPRETDLLAAVGGEAVDVAVDVVGGSQFSELLEALRRGGRYAGAGAIAGPNVELDLRTVYLKDLRLFGCTILEPHVFSNLVRYIEQGEIKPVVSSIHPLSAIVSRNRNSSRSEMSARSYWFQPEGVVRSRYDGTAPCERRVGV